MIARLRGRHRRLVVWVGAIALAGFIAALLARPPRPIEPRLRSVDTTGWTSFGPEERLRASLLGEPGDEYVNVARAPRLVGPDLLVYWSPDAGAPGDAGGRGQVLLGALGDPGVYRYRLPSSRDGGTLVVYSLGHEEVVALHPVDDLSRTE